MPTSTSSSIDSPGSVGETPIVLQRSQEGTLTLGGSKSSLTNDLATDSLSRYHSRVCARHRRVSDPRRASPTSTSRPATDSCEPLRSVEQWRNAISELLAAWASPCDNDDVIESEVVHAG